MNIVNLKNNKVKVIQRDWIILFPMKYNFLSRV